MKRHTRIPVRVTPSEKQFIQSQAQVIGTNVSRLLRGLGLKARELHHLMVLTRRLTARLWHLKSLSYQRQVEPEEIRAAVDGTLEPLQAVEAALQTPPASEYPNPDESSEA